MYQAESSGTLLRTKAATARGRGMRVSRNVVVLGTVSLLTDVASEMVAAILPIYVVFALGGSPLQYGMVDGIYQGATAILRLVGGFIADRRRRYKEVATVGYGISAACKAALVAFGSSISALGAIVLVDRAGKGVRTAPRDALIALSSAPQALATAFGVHRAMDTAGAMLGPLVAFGLLLLAPARFDAIFVVSTCFAVLGLAVLVLLADGRPDRDRPQTASERATPQERPSLREAAALLGRRRFRTLTLAAGVLAATTISDGFVYLGLQRTLDVPLTAFPLLFVGSAAAFMVLAVPAGRLADRVGRQRVFLGGHLLLVVVYLTLLLPAGGLPVLVLALVALGGYYAATDGVLQAIASSFLPDRLRASGLALLVTATSIAKLASSVVFGLLWTVTSLDAATMAFGAALLVALAFAIWTLRRTPELAT